MEEEQKTTKLSHIRISNKINKTPELNEILCNLNIPKEDNTYNEKGELKEKSRASYIKQMQRMMMEFYLSAIDTMSTSQDTEEILIDEDEFYELFDLNKNHKNRSNFAIKLLSSTTYTFKIKFEDGSTFERTASLFSYVDRVVDATTERTIIKMKANENIYPLIYNIGKQSKYSSYTLGTIKNLMITENKNNVQRLYEVYQLFKDKTFKDKGHVVISINDLRTVLSISEKTSSSMINTRYIKPIVETINKQSDIYVTFELIRSGKGGKVTAIDFSVEPNPENKTPLEPPKKIKNDISDKEIIDELMNFENQMEEASEEIKAISKVTENKFTFKEIQTIIPILDSYSDDSVQRLNMIKSAFADYKSNSDKVKTNPLKYFTGILKNKVKDILDISSTRSSVMVPDDDKFKALRAREKVEEKFDFDKLIRAYDMYFTKENIQNISPDYVFSCELTDELLKEIEFRVLASHYDDYLMKYRDKQNKRNSYSIFNLPESISDVERELQYSSSNIPFTGYERVDCGKAICMYIDSLIKEINL